MRERAHATPTASPPDLSHGAAPATAIAERPLDEVVSSLLQASDEAERQGLLQAALTTSDPGAVLDYLYREAVRYLTIQAHTSVQLGQLMITGAYLADRPSEQALGSLILADALRTVGRYEQAVHLYEEARDAFANLRDEVGWARTFTGWVLACHHLGRGQAALDELPPAYEVLVRRQEWQRAAGMDLNAGQVCWRLGRYAEALARYERAQDIYRSLGPAHEARVAWCQGNRALVQALLGDFEAALGNHLAARATFVRHGETLSALRTDQYIADVYAGQADYARALRLYADVLAALEEAGLEIDAAWVTLSIVECYLSLNRNEEARALAEETAARFEACGTPTEAARARFAAATALDRLGDDGHALLALDEAAAVFEQSGLMGHLGLVMLHRGGLRLRSGDCVGALAEAERAEALFTERSVVVRQAQAILLRARAHLCRGELTPVEALARVALTMIRERGLIWLAHEAHHLLADAARRRGVQGVALIEYGAALDSLEAVQRRLVPQLHSDFLADKRQIYHDAIEAALDAEQPALALTSLERAKSRALVDYLTGQPTVRLGSHTSEDAPLVEELARLRAEHAWFYSRLYGYGLGRRDEADTTAADRAVEEATLQAAIDERERRIARLLERLALRQMVEPALVGAAAPAGVLPVLDADTVLLEYYLHDDGSFVFVAADDQLAVIPLPTPLATIQRLLTLWGLNLDAAAQAVTGGASLAALGGNARLVLAQLHEALIRPVAERLAGCPRLVIVPYGPLHALPFSALHDGERYLLESHEVTVVPAAGLLPLCRERATRRRRGILALAFSDDGQLPAAVAEARAVTEVLGGDCRVEAAATRAALTAAAPTVGVLHLASHGEARLDNPTFAHLTLADGQLAMADIFNLNLDGALVTLSACETGRGRVDGGDEVIGLSRAFLYAGAATLVQSLWRVEDGSTARLMATFYRALRDGAAAGAALRAAQLALLAEHGLHPYHWAPFQLIGDDGPLVAPATGGYTEEEQHGGAR